MIDNVELLKNIFKYLTVSELIKILPVSPSFIAIGIDTIFTKAFHDNPQAIDYLMYRVRFNKEKAISYVVTKRFVAFLDKVIGQSNNVEYRAIAIGNKLLLALNKKITLHLTEWTALYTELETLFLNSATEIIGGRGLSFVLNEKEQSKLWALLNNKPLSEATNLNNELTIFWESLFKLNSENGAPNHYARLANKIRN
ncbi:MAG: hypothetical protein K2X39_03240, partial [Silvanigrellaceae bacterium]|nr:hypothetical protein [Silvanigrellaceae bacterium]